MKTADVNFFNEKVAIEIPNSKTYQPRSFMITDQKWITPLEEYMTLRKNVQNEMLFMQIRFEKITNQRIGHNTISQMPKKIAGFLKLSDIEAFTGHCFRRTAATLLANNGGDLMQIKRLGGWKSSTVAEGYIDSSIVTQVNTAKLISKPSSNLTNATLTPNNHEIKLSTKEVQQGLNISVVAYNNANVTINLNKEPC